MEWLVAAAIALVALEAAFQAMVRLGYADFSLPSYAVARAVPFWQVLNKDFGVWHPAHARYSHRKTCFDVIYSANSHGMRDAEAPLASTSPRVVVLGDSFVEGWGVANEQRFTERLEALTGIRHLNFGTSGSFGATQSYLLYKTFASKFEHQAVILSILPDNDFSDDAPSPSALREGAVYRPFLVGDYPNYEIRYPPGGFPQGSSWKNAFVALLDEFSLVIRSRQQIGGLLKDRFAGIMRPNPAESTSAGKRAKIPSSYFDYSPEQFARLRYAIERIKAIAGERPMLVLTIPRLLDYQRAAIAGTPPLTLELKALSAELGITYIDLLEATKDADQSQYFLTCDGHWSSGGHQMAAEHLSKWSALRDLRRGDVKAGR